MRLPASDDVLGSTPARVMFALLRADDVPYQDLMDRTGLSSMAVRQAVRRLEQVELVRRHKRGNRMFVKLTCFEVALEERDA